MKKDQPTKYKQPLEKLDLSSKPDFKKITCPSCGSETPADNININDLVAKCSNCNAVFSVKAVAHELASQQKITPNIDRPKGIEVYHFKKEMDITLRQPPTPMEIILSSAIFIAQLVAFGLYDKGTISAFWSVLVFGLAIYYVVYMALLRKKHHIYVRVNKKKLSVQRRPKKLVKDKDYDVRDIDQVYISNRTGNFTVYLILNEVDGQKHVPIIKHLTNLTQAKYLEQEIESYLGIQDRKVLEEVKL